MYLEFVRADDGAQIPHVGGKLAYPLVKYLMHLRNTPMRRGGRREKKTLENIYSHMKIWLDYCADLGLEYDRVTYEVHLESLRSSLRERGVEAESLNVYYRSWRSFYEWCDSQNLPHLMQFPAKHEIARTSDATGVGIGRSFRTSSTAEVDPGLDSVAIVSDYKEKIVNEAEFKLLSEALIDIDPVYGKIGYMMATTGLRVGGVIQLPVGADSLNPEWLRYPELEATKRKFQSLVYIPKGGKRKQKCIVLTEALGVLHNEYITTVRTDRVVLYQEKFGTKYGVPLWLNCHGKQVTKHDIWEAFRLASKKIGRRVTPHFLRHTYASYVVYYYFKANGLTPSLAYAHDIHEQLRIQLGHSDMKTTLMYIRTVIRTKMEAWLPVLTPFMKQEVDTHLPQQVLAAVTSFFEPHAPR
ncbi:tyrosine-type recombinase/integrase [Pseudomonas sp. GB2N2]